MKKNNLFVKVPLSLLEDERIRKLTEYYGPAALGVLLILWLETDFSTHGSTVQQLMNLSRLKKVSRTQRKQIFEQSGLFNIDENGLVSINYDRFKTLRRGVRKEVRKEVREEVREEVRAAVPLLRDIDIDILSSSKEDDNAADDGDDAFEKKGAEPSAEDTMISNIRQWLNPNSPTVWKESLLMKVPSLPLAAHWKEATEFFLRHASAMSRLEELYNESASRRYFMLFCTNARTHRLLSDYLASLSPHTANKPLQHENMVYNYATEQWIRMDN